MTSSGFPSALCYSELFVLGSYSLSPSLPQPVLPATPDPAGLSRSGFAPHSCRGVAERIGHIRRVSFAQCWT